MRHFNLKRVAIPLLAGCLILIQLKLSAQNKQNIAEQKNTQPLTDVLKKISKIYGTRFVYEESMLGKIAVSFEVERGTDVEEVLKKLLYPKGLVFLYIKKNYYAIVSDQNRNIVMATVPGTDLPPQLKISSREESGNLVVEVKPADGREITGQVKDKNGVSLENVTVTVRGTNIATATDVNGNYKLEGVPLKNAVLLFSSIGYGIQEVPVKSENVINLVLKQSSVALQEVVVLGYGEKKKEDLTAAVSSIGSKELDENHSSVALSDMLAGQMAGLFVQKTGGAPGSGSDLKVRGLSTFNNSSPLIVVDGIPDRNIDELNAIDIEAVSVLKDAASIAVYGARAANGVVLVTTKKGRPGKTEITFSSNLIQQRPTYIYGRVNSYQYATLQNEALQNENTFNPSLGEGFSDSQIQKFKDGSDPNHYPNTDWIKTLTQPTVLQNNYNLSASGGTQNTKYFLSVGYVKNGGIVPVEDYSRWNFRSNLEADITTGLKVDFNLAGVLSKQNGEAVYGSEYVISQAYITPPTRANQFSNGYYAFVPEQRGSGYLQSIGKTGYNTTNNNTFNSNLSLQYDLPWIKGLSIKGMGAYDKFYSFTKNFAIPYDQYSVDSAGDYSLIPSYPISPYLSEAFSESRSLTLEGSLLYGGSFGRSHVNGLLLYTQTQSYTDNFSTTRKNFVSPLLAQLTLGDPTQVVNDGSGSQSARQGLVGRFSYDFAERYLLEFSFRYDGSDIFPPGHRFGFFPSFSGGWILSNEPFFKEPFNGLDFVKIRGSWGELGNDRVNPYQFLSTYNLIGGNFLGGGYTFGGPNPTFYQSLQANLLPNPSFTWERAVMTDIGIELRYKKDLFTLEADYFYKRTKDILAPPALQVPSVIGIGLPDFNNGIVDNKGFEITLSHTLHIGKFFYRIQPNLSYNHNKIVYYPESRSTPAWQKITGSPVASYTGYGSPYLGYRSLGLYQTQQDVDKGPVPLFSTTGPGDIRYADIDKDGMITPNDMVVIGQHFFPAIQYGIRVGAGFSGIELNILIQGSADVQAYNYISNYNQISGSSQQLNHWTPQNPNAPFPRLWVNYQNNPQPSDYWVANTAYTRIKNIELAYSLPAKFLNKIGIKNFRLSISGNNLITFSKFKLADPEAAGVAQFRDPLIKSFTAGAILQF